MITMDLKGITWVGHLYQEFEAMCLDAEEVMYQDTVKYVEDQVHIVSASVKKFYSDVVQDVMQDLLLPSSLECMKTVAASDMPLEKHAETLKKPNLGLKEATKEDEGELLIEDSEVISDVSENAAHVPSSCRLHMVDNAFQACPRSFMERASCDLFSGKHNNCSTLVKSNVENLAMAGAFSKAACVENGFSWMSSFSGKANANNEVSCQQIPTTLTTVSVEEDGSDSIEKSCNEIESASESIPEILNDDLQLVEPIGIKMEMRCSSSVIGSAEPNGQSNNRAMNTSGSSSNAVGRKEIETFRPLDKTGVDESCIMVNGAELHFLHRREGKQKPYQKKICYAISSRMRLTRSKEYKQIALSYGGDVKSDEDCEGSSMSALSREDTRSQIHDVLDLEWELL